jgi:hypothetical protein
MYERTGDVNDVVFPCGWVLVDGEIRIYYGSADTSVSLATAKMSDVLKYIHDCPETQCPEEYCRWFEGNRGRLPDPKKGYFSLFFSIRLHKFQSISYTSQC